MRDQDSYRERAARLRGFLAEDTELSGTVSARRRLSVLGRAVNDAESGLSRLDPLFPEVRARYVEALHLAKPRSSRPRALVGTAIQEACETHGPDSPIVSGLRRVQRRIPGRSASRRIERKVDRAEEKVAGLRGDGPHGEYASALCKLAELYGEAGRYDAMIGAYDRLMEERVRLDLAEDRMTRLEESVANIYYYLHAEAARATPLLEGLYAKDGSRRRPDVPFDDLLDGAFTYLLLARCYLATGRPAAAEKMLRESLERLRRHDHRLADARFHRLRHRTTYELGSALWKRGRAREATAFIEEAHGFVAGPKFADRQAALVYHSAMVYTLL
ncbi:hypothetical protein [Nocardiopsis sp. M1B1]|uniref:hypothetical protein n=1 Tax=Nocardiopsis sp. M1B1 TaxID=3450454 RepID=UPI00403917A8